MDKNNIRNFCVAPMMGYTTPHSRYFFRQMSKKAFLFTEMVASKALLYSYKQKILLQKNKDENPVAFQIGGSDPKELSKCAKIVEKNGFDEINLNVGCPSKAVLKGRFGACLMKEKDLVKNCLIQMQNNTSIPVTIKCRIGVDNDDNYSFFRDFIGEILDSNISIIYIHARKALLNGFSPKYNRNVPTLKYDYVYRIKKEFPNATFILNGGIDNIDKALNLKKDFDGIMVGRLIQSNPFILKEIDNRFYNKKNSFEKKLIIKNYFKYIRKNINNDSIYRLCSPLLNIFFGIPNSKKIKITINQYMHEKKIDKLENIFNNFALYAN